MEGIDGKIGIRAREEGTWPPGALCDLSVTSRVGPSAALFLSEAHVRLLIERLTEQLPPDETVWQLCCVCGTITPEELWTYWHQNLDEATEIERPWVPAREGEEDPMALCPVCRWHHRDTDDGSGFYSGTRAEMDKQRSGLILEFAGWNEHWAYSLEQAATAAVR